MSACPRVCRIILDISLNRYQNIYSFYYITSVSKNIIPAWIDKLIVTFIITTDCHAWTFLSGVNNVWMRLCNFGGARFPVESISHVVWLYFHCCLSHRDVEDVLFVCGVIVSYETIHHSA